MSTLKKIVTTGLGAALITEEGVRNATAYLARQALQRKDDLSNILSAEIAKFLKRINIHEEIRKALQGLTFEIKIKRTRD